MFSIALAGLGTVGSALVRQLRDNAAWIEARVGQPVVIKAVSARNKSRKRECDLSGIDWVDDPVVLASLPGVDAVVELIGGAEGVALQLAEAALSHGCHFVTANKALLAKHGPSLALLAGKNKAQLSFEAAVAGGIPVIKALREGLAGDEIEKISGILNGTCNYILTRMFAEGLSFETVLADAQKKGYAEADPSSDIDGHDTANKLSILSSLAFGVKPDLSSIKVEGIRHITLADLQFAKELGFRIKLLGMAQKTSEGIVQRVGPALIPEEWTLANVDGALNSVSIRGRTLGPLTLEGKGAGGEPTANAVTSDILDIARGTRIPAFSVPAESLTNIEVGRMPACRYYMRLQVQDRPGVVADISAIMRDEALSFESLIQRGKSKMESVPVIITTHAGDFDSMHRAAKKIAKIQTVMEYPCLIPIEEE